MFIIEDEMHAEPQKGQFKTFEDAYAEIQRRAAIPWTQKPNRCPCTNWKECERSYQILEYDTTKIPWRELRRTEIMTISAKGVKWMEINKNEL